MGMVIGIGIGPAVRTAITLRGISTIMVGSTVARGTGIVAVDMSVVVRAVVIGVVTTTTTGTVIGMGWPWIGIAIAIGIWRIVMGAAAAGATA